MNRTHHHNNLETKIGDWAEAEKCKSNSTKCVTQSIAELCANRSKDSMSIKLFKVIKVLNVQSTLNFVSLLQFDESFFQPARQPVSLVGTRCISIKNSGRCTNNRLGRKFQGVQMLHWSLKKVSSGNAFHGSDNSISPWIQLLDNTEPPLTPVLLFRLNYHYISNSQRTGLSRMLEIVLFSKASEILI